MAINPYARLPLYSSEMITKYSAASTLAELDPHIFAVAAATRTMEAQAPGDEEILYRRPAAAGSTRVTLSCDGVGVATTEPLLARLRAMYTRSSDGPSAPGGPLESDRAFLRAAFCCLARYASAMGGLKRSSGGLHAALPGGVFAALARHLDISVELFASPLNVNPSSSAFCSAHGDVDSAFGSLGSFFEHRPTEGSFEANPPFVDEIVMRMVGHMEELLSRAEAGGRALSFAVIVKKDRDAAGWRAIRDSTFKRFQMTLWQGEHHYRDGASYHRSSPARPHRAALHDSSFFLLQTSRGAARWRLDEERWQSIRDAFNAA